MSSRLLAMTDRDGSTVIPYSSSSMGFSLFFQQSGADRSAESEAEWIALLPGLRIKMECAEVDVGTLRKASHPRRVFQRSLRHPLLAGGSDRSANPTAHIGTHSSRIAPPSAQSQRGSFANSPRQDRWLIRIDTAVNRVGARENLLDVSLVGSANYWVRVEGIALPRVEPLDVRSMPPKSGNG